MKRLLRENKEIQVPENQVASYLKDGYKEIDEKGNFVKCEVEVNPLEAVNERLKTENLEFADRIAALEAESASELEKAKQASAKNLELEQKNKDLELKVKELEAELEKAKQVKPAGNQGSK